jgi:aryl-alcohol dehydrogenase-like predicted oxidoreductase
MEPDALEQIIGRFLRERPDRDQIIICTKGGNNMVTGARNFTPDYIRGCLEGSLQRLGVDAIDVYLLHNPSVQNLKSGDSFELLEKFKAEEDQTMGCIGEYAGGV